MSATRVACLAFDSAGTKFLDEGIATGRLPTLAGMLDRGRGVALRDRQEIATSTTWPTLIRGCEVSDHRLYADRAYAPGEYRIVDVSVEAAERPPFWRHLSDAGLRSVVLSPYSGPLLDDFRGIQVCGWGSHDPFDAKLGRRRSDPPELVAELDRLVGPRALRYDATPPRGARRLRAYIADMVEGVGQQARAMNRLLSMEDWSFAFASFGEGHQAGHWLWHLADPVHRDHDPDIDAGLRDGLMRVYEATDRAIGTVLDGLPPETVVLVISPYDMYPNHHFDEAVPLVLERGGWLVRRPVAELPLRARRLRAGRRMVRAAVPLALRPALGRLAGRDRLLADMAVSAIDWAATTAVAVPSDGSAALRLNLAGREPAGLVTPGAEADRMLDDLAAAFNELRCADSGLPVVARTARYEELYDAEPLTGPADLFVQWARLPRPSAVRSQRVGEVPVPFERSIRSVHCAPGYIVGAGPGISGSADSSFTGPGEARLADLAATVLALLGVPAPATVTGRPIPGLVPAVAEAGA